MQADKTLPVAERRNYTGVVHALSDTVKKEGIGGLFTGAGTTSIRAMALNMGMLQSGLDECLQWFICLANDIVDHQTQKGFDAHLSASSLDEQERQRQQTRREALQKARHDARLGAILAKQRDDRKRSYDDMNEAEQKTLEDYETGRTKRAKQRFTTPGMKPFRSKLQRGHHKLSKQL